MARTIAHTMKQHGFKLEGTGGGCTAYVRGNADGSVEVITSRYDPSHPTSFAEPVTYGRYVDAGEWADWEKGECRGYPSLSRCLHDIPRDDVLEDAGRA